MRIRACEGLFWSFIWNLGLTEKWSLSSNKSGFKWALPKSNLTPVPKRALCDTYFAVDFIRSKHLKVRWRPCVGQIFYSIVFSTPTLTHIAHIASYNAKYITYILIFMSYLPFGRHQCVGADQGLGAKQGPWEPTFCCETLICNIFYFGQQFWITRREPKVLYLFAGSRSCILLVPAIMYSEWQCVGSQASLWIGNIILSPSSGMYCV